MIPYFGNPVGFWALLGIPLIVAIYFLQQKSKEYESATLFLLNAIAPEDREGHVWERLRQSLAFWMQILAILLLTWVLVEPSYPRENASQTVVFVLDESADMEPFRADAQREIMKDIAHFSAKGIPTNWILLGSRPGGTPLYKGNDVSLLLSSLSNWKPCLSTHDVHSSLHLAQALTQGRGMTRFITCRPERIPSGQSGVSVGKHIRNLGFVGVSPLDASSPNSWRIAVKNNSTVPQSPEITIRLQGRDELLRQKLDILPQQVAEFRFVLPEGVDRADLSLPSDAFSADNRMILLRTSPTPFTLKLSVSDKLKQHIRKIVQGIPGYTANANETSLVLEVTEDVLCQKPAIIVAAKGDRRLDEVTAEEHPLVSRLNWSGLLVPTIGTIAPSPQASMLLWHGGAPLAWLNENQLILNWVWDESNASQLAAPTLLIRRFIEQFQTENTPIKAGNLPSGAQLEMKEARIFESISVDGNVTEGVWTGILPASTCELKIYTRDKKSLLFHGAVWFSDARMGDFSACKPINKPYVYQQEQRELMQEVPGLVWCLLLAMLCLMLAWLPRNSSKSSL